MQRKRAFFAGLLLVTLGAARLVAQSVSPAEGPEETGKEFVAYLARQDFESLRNMVARDSVAQLGDGGVEALLRDLRLLPDRWETKGEGDTALVTPVFEAKPVLCRREGRFWRVDLLATAGRWMKLDEAAAPRRLIREYSVLPRFGEESRTLCLGNLQSLAIALKQYQEDYDDRYPPANRWNDSLAPFARGEKAYHCPAAGKQSYGYAMNWKLSRRSRSEVTPPADGASPVAIYESARLERNVNGDGRDLAYRHEGATQTLFCDGTARSLPRGAQPEFRLPKK